MKLLKLTILDRTDTHVIAELEYSDSKFFGGEKIIKRKVFKKINDAHWRFLDTNEINMNYEGLNAVISTNKDEYNI